MKTPSRLILHTALASSALLPVAGAQSFNMDVNAFDSPTPSNSYGAFSGQTGYWQPITSISPINTPLYDVNGALTQATMTYFPAQPPGNFPVTQNTQAFTGSTLSTGFRSLMDDYEGGGPNSQIRIYDLLAGEYAVYVYAWAPNGGAPIYFQTGTSGPGIPVVLNHGPTLQPGADPFVSPTTPPTGQNMAVRTVTVQPGEQLIITALCQGFLLPGGTIVDDGDPKSPKDGGTPGDCTIAGLQIIPVTGMQGCQQTTPNSVEGLPRINAFGQTFGGAFSISSSTITLSAGSLPLPIGGPLPGERRIQTWVAADSMPGVPQWQPACGGLFTSDTGRCIGATALYRLGPVMAQSDANGVHTQIVNFAQLAQSGFVPGTSLHVQMLYEDDSVPSDPCTSMDILRWTDSLEITLIP